MFIRDLAGDQLVAYARAWMAADPDSETVTETAEMLERADLERLRDQFGSRLTFGTAGLRGPLAAGPNRMNRLVVRQSAAGLGRRILAEGAAYAKRGVVVGYDARHKSNRFAEDTARVLAAQGIPVFLFEHIVPTPILAFAVAHLGCAAGVQVTASHNPPQDNGYKVYWGDGPQIVSPLDVEIAAEIDAVAAIGGSPELAPEKDPLIQFVDASVVKAYHDGVAALDTRTSDSKARASLRIVYTAMHGVGGATLLRVFRDAGFNDVQPVLAQLDPNPDFPTVAFPNPEEHGALDLSYGDAKSIDAHLILANDPDADRMSAAIPDPSAFGGWRQLRGDEVGWLLAEHLLACSASAGAKRLVATTIVSSSLLSAMAAKHGVQYRETLTGFKWLARNALAHRELTHVLSYEEALGYSVGSLVLDKDGISAALVLADLAAARHAAGSSLLEALHEIEAQYGRFDTEQQSLRFDGSDAQEKMGALMSQLRANLPNVLGGVPVTSVRDISTEDPAADVVILRLGENSENGPAGRVTVRPSGTEPKCKIYYEVVSRGDTGGVSINALQHDMSLLLGLDS
jgi:phosphomannomutase